MGTSANKRVTRPVYVGSVKVGGDAAVVVQSMTSTDTRDAKATIDQIGRLTDAGCEIARVAVPDAEAAAQLSVIKRAVSVPLIADIHFDHRLALAAIEQGVDGVRINPGNLGRQKIREVVKAAMGAGIVIRVGVNAGSLEKSLLAKYGGPTAEALVESALGGIALLEDLGFRAIKVSLKSSDVSTMIAAYRGLAEKSDYPLHLGVTEAGTLVNAAIKSSIALGILLSEGIGDTIRVSVTGDPVVEIGVAYGILRALGIRDVGPDIISCPTCGRCEIDLCALVEEVERRLAGMKAPLKIALMGCVVNGPGEAAEADVGIAGGKGMGLLFRRGKVIGKVREGQFVEALLEEIDQMTASGTSNALPVSSPGKGQPSA
ncbi:MAG: flavodoxin-dependent (E)-4-hydroxy-3-methylbut-2-enyl-diphosphate synthase [Deltaproteobacteria bacterium]|nr:flavodoxin-dependent (E)-4-hydroxy-3-methylbut-2-enyl-diphosphate synthase [Deltaproteobacteria bacterium]